MKLIKALIHHVRSAPVVEALAQAGFRNVTLQDVRGTLKALTYAERDYSKDAAGLVISEVRLSLVVDDSDVDVVTAIIAAQARIGSGVSGYIYVSPVDDVIVVGDQAGTETSRSSEG